MVGGVDRDLSIRRDGLTDLDSPKHGKMDPDNAPHVGGNTWAGGTGGRDTGKYFSEALILASTNPQYDKRFFIELRVQ